MSIKSCPSREYHPDSQNFHSDAAKIDIIIETSKFWSSEIKKNCIFLWWVATKFSNKLNFGASFFSYCTFWYHTGVRTICDCHEVSWPRCDTYNIYEKQKKRLICRHNAHRQRVRQRGLPFQVLLRLLLDDNLISAHKLRMYLSSSSTLAKLFPCCFSARSILAKNSSSVINVESFFSFTSFLANRVSRFISGSLSAINHACTECGTCASVCPSEAISLPWSHRTYRA